ncbi:hypothetical protein [Agrococcus sp. Marseille-Q4369]|uniref:hypothetical protein n=1 Tax=Agrococcus sp. Marseille-Q4369 TaxID=2810513 RepID=UPI001B8BBF77|nr:hypothetical protein [Agrococcus sp. Marseille-Q4369]QUW19665.1 hypothetical protein JSQ78_05045 [Agrococcus sp. Marseille-Q4369]
MLVAISVLAVVMTLLTMLFVALSSTFTRQEAQHDSTGGASVGMQRIERVIHAGSIVSRGTQVLPAFEAGNQRSVSLHAFFDTDVASGPTTPTRVTLEVTSSGELVETRVMGRVVSGRWVFDRPAVSRQTITRDVLVPGSRVNGTSVGSLFRYELADGSLIDRPLTSAELGLVVAVRVSLSVRADSTGRVAPTRIERTLGLPNLDATR